MSPLTLALLIAALFVGALAEQPIGGGSSMRVTRLKCSCAENGERRSVNQLVLLEGTGQVNRATFTILCT